MTLIAAQIDGNRIEILADGLSCHDKLTITRSRQIGANVVQSDVPGRTSLQKIFPQPHSAFAIVHCGSNQCNGTPIGTIVERFWHRAASESCLPGSLVNLFKEEFPDGPSGGTLWLVGWLAPGTPIVHVVGIDSEHLDGGRYWAGSGRNSLSHEWSDLNSLQENAERFLGECQEQAPFDLPFFANCYGGHWHRLQLTPAESPKWLTEPRYVGIEVATLLPGPSRQAPCDNPAQLIGSRGEGLKEVLRGTFNVTTVRGALKRVTDERLRERIARLIAIFDEVQLDPAAATVEDARRYATAVDDVVARLVEREVLDQRHRQCDILGRNDTAAIGAILRRYAQALRDLRTGKIPKPSDGAKSQTANEGLRGLGHCLRWVKECCPSALLVPTPGPEALGHESLELLQWSAAYDPIWNQHSAYSRGLVDVQVDEQDKTITFLPHQNMHPRFFCTQVEAKKADDERLAGTRPDPQLAALSKDWYDSVASSDKGLHFDDAAIRASGAIDVASSWMEKTCLPELLDATTLMGCTVGELRRVLATVYVYSLFVSKLEDVTDDQPVLGVVLPSCVVVRQSDDMVAWLAGLSGVPATSVQAILSVLTFDPTHPHVTLAQQPIVGSADGRLFFLPRMVLFLDLPRMYVGAINKHKQGRAVYAQTINTIEAAGVEWIANGIRAAVPNTLQIVRDSTFSLPDGQQISPDIVVASERDEAVLVIDVKYATPPFGPADVHRDVQEMGKWKTRMAEYVNSFKSNPDVLAQHFHWASRGQMTVVGLILMRWPFPIPVDFTGPVGAVDWPSLKEHIHQARPSSIGDLMEWVRDRPDVTVPMALAWTAKEVLAGDWKYRYSVLAPLSKERLFELTQKVAYSLWEERGKPLWDDLRDWLDAEERFATNPYLAVETEIATVPPATKPTE